MRLLWLAAVLAVPARVGWAQHGGHGGHGGYETMPMSGSHEDDERAERKSRLEKLERLGEKIEKIEAELEKPDISAKKREKLKKKLDKLFAKRDRLLPGAVAGPSSAPAPGEGRTVAPGGVAVYSCPMGHYSGAKTKDGRCPECGMALERGGSHGAQGRFETVRSSGAACPGQADAGAAACKSP